MSTPLRLLARSTRGCLALGFAAVACRSSQATDETGIPARELEYRDRFSKTPIGLRGGVEDLEHRPIAEARVAIADLETRTDAEGRFEFTGLDRHTRVLTVEASGYRTEQIAVHLHRALSVTGIAIDPVLMAPRLSEEARFLFAGDSSLGRRFMSPEGENPLRSIPPPDEEALIPSDRAGPAARTVVAEMVPLFESAEYRTVNLETVVTDTPDTPYQGKPYVFYTLPDALSALETLGVGFVSLGNNHMYDYLEKGIADTLRHVSSRGIGLAGAGATPDEAYTAFRVSVGGLPYSMISASSIQGDQYDTPFVATEEQGGAANAWDTERLTQAIETEVAAGRHPIVHLHTGAEYSEVPTESAHGRMRLAIDSGAALVVAHHPHVPQGFEWYEDHLIAHSLGNFVFDQDRVETVLTHVFRADLKGSSLSNGRSIPTYIEDFCPRPFGGEMADVHIRRIGSVSTPYGGLVFPYLGQGWVVQPDQATLVTDTIQLPVVIDETGFAIVDLRGLADSRSSLARIEVESPGVTARVGRDILLFGDMEDADVDDDELETSRWWYSNASSFPCMHEVYRGAVALCSYRDSKSTGAAVLAFRNRVRVRGHAEQEPQKDLSLLAYTQGENAGPVTIDVRYYASEGELTFGNEIVWDSVSGDWDWKPVTLDLTLPPDDPDDPDSPTKNPRAVRVFFEHLPPKQGAGYFRVDDVAFVNWEQSLAVDGSEELDIPHPRDFIRFEGPPGLFTATVTMKTLRPL